jgi:hypothetical protein
MIHIIHYKAVLTHYILTGLIVHADHVAPSIRKKLAITSSTSGGSSVGIVHSRTQTMEFSFLLFHIQPVHSSYIITV